VVPIHVIGGGLAGSEAALQIARAGLPAILHEMRPVRQTAAHHTDRFAELVCSNSLKSEQENSAPWLLKEELRRLGCFRRPRAHGGPRRLCRGSVAHGGSQSADRNPA
jgi:methylenetetrahydrofolate--tRNA-(uracil-5-)-methyltransferase